MQKNESTYKILIVEDNSGDFAIIEELLQEQILLPSIERAKSFKEASAMLAAQSLKFDVILLDLSLPDKSGLELITEMVVLSANCPILVLTGYSDVSFGVKSLSLGISDYLLKDELSASSLFKSVLYSIERRKALSSLEESEKRYSDLFQLSPQPMLVYNLDTLGFLHVNSAAIKHYGFSMEEFLTMTIADILQPDDLSGKDELVHESPQKDDLFFQGIFRHRKKNGELINVDVQSNIIQFEGKKAKLILANDITESLSYIDAIEKQNEKLKEIAWIQSHIVRAPLARMMGLIDLIKNDAKVDKTEVINYILHSAYELDGIIRDISNKTDHIKLD